MSSVNAPLVIYLYIERCKKLSSRTKIVENVSSGFFTDSYSLKKINVGSDQFSTHFPRKSWYAFLPQKSESTIHMCRKFSDNFPLCSVTCIENLIGRNCQELQIVLVFLGIQSFHPAKLCLVGFSEQGLFRLLFVDED